MNINKKIGIAYKLLEMKLINKRCPVIVSWVLTYRCNRQCIYCDSWKIKSDELNTESILLIIDEMARTGVQVLHFTGGNPLLKEDIGAIIDYCKKKKINTDINSNGSLVKEKINELAGLDLLSLSLDGDEETNDLIRGKGSYRDVMEAIEVVKQRGLKLRFTTVLSKLNLNAVDFILKKAQELKIHVVFQPARFYTLAGLGKNPIAPVEEDYKKIISELIVEKRKNRYIVNSISGLKYLYNWPNPTETKCVNSLIICRLQPNGDMYGCGRNLNRSNNVPSCKKLGFKECFESLIPVTCKECWCASFVEINHLFSLNLDAIINVVKMNLV